MADSGQIYSATYSNVPVYEFKIGANNVMRRRADGWINATHILKVADFDKPARTRILGREVQKGVHEKVQGGYGKYQGTWIPLQDGRALAEKNNVLDKLRVIFDYVPGDATPPPAPKHVAAAPGKRPGRQSMAAKKRMQASLSNIAEEGDEPATPDDLTIASDIYADDYADMSSFTYSRSKKRKRMPEESFADAQHKYWSEDLLNYFMLSEDPMDPNNIPPTPPEGIDLDRAIDEKGNNALHWASAMGDLNVVKELIARGAEIHAQSDSLETPLMRAVIFTNNFDKRTMDKLAGYFVDTVASVDAFGNTVFHHITNTTQSKSKYACARYYLDCILNKMAERYSPVEIEEVLNTQDHVGDTAMTIAARHGARKCVRSLIGRNAAVDIPNESGQTADELIVQLNHRRRDGRHRQLSSSPFQIDPSMAAARGLAHPIFDGSTNGSKVSALSSPHTATPTQSNTKVNVHASEAGSTLTTQFLPLMQTKSIELATAFDVEMAEKDNELLEANAAIKSREEEIEQLKRQSRGLEISLAEKDSTLNLMPGSVNGQMSDLYDSRLASDLVDLLAEAERVLEGEQALILSTALSEDTASTNDTTHNQEDLGPELYAAMSDPQNIDERRAKFLFAQRIAALQARRRQLLKEVVNHSSLIGTGQRQAEYKRLMARALGVDEDRVEAMLPELLNELELDSASHGIGLRGTADSGTATTYMPDSRMNGNIGAADGGVLAGNGVASMPGMDYNALNASISMIQA